MSEKKSLYHTVYYATLSLFFIFMIFVIAFNIFLSYSHFKNAQETITEDIISSKKELLKNQLDFFYYTTKELSKEDFLERISHYKFGKDDYNYIFAASYDGISLTYPAKGKNVYNITDFNGLKVVQELIKVAKTGKGFVKYAIPVGKESKTYKLSYVIGIDKWNLYIGIGETLNEIEQSIKERKDKLLERFYYEMIIIVIASLFFVFLLYMVFAKFNKNLKKDIDTFSHSLDMFVNKQKPINQELVKYQEFHKLSAYTHELFHKKNILEKELKEKEAIFYQQAKLASMGEMIENIAHQWRQPLNMITLSSSAMQFKQEQGNLDETFLIKSLDNITQSAEYLSHTIEDFRTFFVQNKVKTSFRVDESIQKAIKLLQARIEKQNVQVILNLDHDSIISYKNELLQVYLVIFNNALDALETVQNEKYIWVRSHTKDDFVYINIQDNGNGIEKNHLEKIFEPYFTTKHQSQGTGIGLYMAKEIIQKHLNGSLNISNKTYSYDLASYKGAQVEIKIPVNIS